VGTGGNETGASPALAGGCRPTGPPVVWSTVSEPVALSSRRQHDEQKRRPRASEPSVRAAIVLPECSRRGSAPDPRIMIPARFGLAIGISRPVGHVVGHNRVVVRAAFRMSLASRATARGCTTSGPRRRNHRRRRRALPERAAGAARARHAHICPATRGDARGHRR
jgi:hypothetical protein